MAKKEKIKEEFFEELKKVPIIQVCCEKTGVSRQSVYRWRKEDEEFAKKMDEAVEEGVAFVNDMSESQLLTLIKEKNWSAISFWLRHRNQNYKQKLEVTTKEESEELTPEQEAVVRRALKLTAQNLKNNQNEHEKEDE